MLPKHWVQREERSHSSNPERRKSGGGGHLDRNRDDHRTQPACSALPGKARGTNTLISVSSVPPSSCILPTFPLNQTQLQRQGRESIEVSLPEHRTEWPKGQRGSGGQIKDVCIDCTHTLLFYNIIAKDKESRHSHMAGADANLSQHSLPCPLESPKNTYQPQQCLTRFC